ncbi:MAG: DUF5678 domain-containing protein, partial [Anaerolineae bacterium]
QTENGVSFAAVYSIVDWAQQPPDIIERVLRALLLAGDHESARQLALRAANRYTDHVGLSKFAATLNPPPARISRIPPDTAIKATMAWFASHSMDFRGQWVAVSNGALVASAPTIAELRNRVGDLTQVTITQIP